MSRLKSNSKVFSNKLYQKIESIIADYEFDTAEKMIKRFLSNTNYDNKTRALFYSLLGKLRYLTGQFNAAKRYFNIALKLSPQDFDAIYNLANVYMFEQNLKTAKKYVALNLKNHPSNVNVLIQFMWCQVLSGNYEDAEIIYKRLLKERKLDSQGFSDLAMAYASKGNFSDAKKIIFAGLSNFPDSFVAEDTLYEINEIEQNFKDYKKEIFFKKIQNIRYLSNIYVAALRLLVEGMSLRNYFKFEIEKAAEFLLFLNREKFEIDNPKLLAAAIEYNISICIGEEESLRNIIVNSYKISRKKLAETVQAINLLSAKKGYNLCDDILAQYDENFGIEEGSENESGGDDDEW